MVIMLMLLLMVVMIIVVVDPRLDGATSNTDACPFMCFRGIYIYRYRDIYYLLFYVYICDFFW